MKKIYEGIMIEFVTFNQGKDVLNEQSTVNTYFSSNGDDCGYDFWD